MNTCVDNRCAKFSIFCRMKLIYLIVISFLLSGCGIHEKNIAIWIENDSDLYKSIEVSTFLDDSLMDKRHIEKDSIADRYSPFYLELNLPGQKKESTFKFVVSIDGDQTSCEINIDTLDKSTFLHVNYVERLLKKGAQFDNDTLKRDTVYRKDFYCEIEKFPN